MRIWIDADSCPVKIREIIIKAAERTNVKVIQVANRKIPHKKTENIENIIVPAEKDSADNYILKEISCNDIVITRDIPFAYELVKKEINVLNDRGILYTRENIGERLSLRNFMLSARENGLEIEKEGSFSKKEIQNFANSFDSLLTRVLKYYN